MSRVILGVGACVALALPACAEAAPRPRLGHSVVVRHVRGTVLVKARGAKHAVRLRGRRTLPLGSTVDTTHGRVAMTAAGRGRHLDKGQFWAGAYTVRQTRAKTPITVLDLAKGNFTRCAGAAQSADVHIARRHVRRLWGNAHGHFRTRGRHASATVRGTEWLTDDRCDATAVATARGKVEYSNGGTTTEVDQGDVFASNCPYILLFETPPSGIFRYFSLYCVAVAYELPRGGTRRGAYGPLGYLYFGFIGDIYTAEERRQYPATADYPRTATACIRRVGGAERCSDYPLAPASSDDPTTIDPDDFCRPDAGPGTFVVRWQVGDEPVPEQLVADVPKPDPVFAPQPGETPCVDNNHDPVP